jgi:CIC family chloride channel protein
VGGLAVGIMGYFVPEVMGVGYDYVEKVLNGNLVLQLVALLAVLKLVATAVCYASGNAGGIFGPSLFIGAMMGGAVGSVAHHFFPEHTAGPGAYALVGMGTAFAGIVRTPLTSVIMIFEMTRDYTIIVPLMISNLIAFFISQRLQRQPIYEALARQDGVHLPSSESRAGQGKTRVVQVMRKTPLVLTPEMEVTSAVHLVKSVPLEAWPVADQRGLWGMIRNSELQEAAFELKYAAADGDPVKTLADIPSQGFGQGLDPDQLPHVHPDQTLSHALERMGSTNLHVLPVVSRANVRELLGIVVLEDVLDAYGVGWPTGTQEYGE